MLKINLEEETLNNSNFRKVIKTTKNIQLVLMSLKIGENIPREIHEDNDQFFRVEYGNCKIITDNETIILNENMSTIIPMNTFHEVINIGNTELKLYTIYSPPHHPHGTIQKNKPAEDIQDGGLCYRKNEFYCDKFMRYMNKLNNI